ncbi:sulfate permease [Actinokineospora terrae]|uniref:sulfate permease n=1 Tax=Actinokineospora terrae TaxID=155974 RepID=UPI000B81F65D|nr:sulfate permease [Actinokineospora terrae]
MSRRAPVPLAWVREYRRSWLRGDAVAGVTVAAYLVPQVMAYAAIAGVAPVAGLWAAVGALAVYAVLGTSRQLSVGPESSTALMTAAAVAPLAGGDPLRYGALASALALLVAGLCLAGRVAGLGFLADLLSRPVLVGYLAGIAVLMVLGQLGKVIGADLDNTSALTQLLSFARALPRAHPPTVVLAAAVLAFLVLAARLWPRLPVPLLGVLLASAATALFSLPDNGVRVVGAIPAGVVLPGVPAVSASDLGALLLPAVGVAVVGYADNVLTARSFASRAGHRVDANAELLALGAANAAAGLLHGFPVSSSASRTSLGAAVGSRTQAHSLVAAAAVVAILVVGRPLLASFPVAALGALVIYAAIRLVDVAGFAALARFRRSEALIAATTVVAVLVLGVLEGVVAAVAMSLVELLRRVARPHDGVLGYVDGVAGMHDVDDYPGAAQVPGLVVYRYDAPLFFANAEDFRHRALAAVAAAPTRARWLLLNAEAIVDIDLTAVDALEDLRAELADRGVVLALARVKQELRVDLARTGFLERVGEDHVFTTLPTAVRAFTSSR